MMNDSEIAAKFSLEAIEAAISILEARKIESQERHAAHGEA